MKVTFLQLRGAEEYKMDFEMPHPPGVGDTVKLTLDGETTDATVSGVSWSMTGWSVHAWVRLFSIPAKQKDIHTNPNDVVRKKS